MRFLVSGAVLLLSVLPCAGQSILEVPGAYPTINDAIIAASDGDTVLVAPGTYVQTIYDLGKDITIISSGGPAVTVIRHGTIFSQTVDLSGSHFEGFTVTVGDPTGIVMVEDSVVVNCIVTGNEGYDGGGIRATGGAIIDTVVTGNTAERGGGIYATYGTDIINCEVSGNDAEEGGGIYLVESGCRDSVITGNTAIVGGGVYKVGHPPYELSFSSNVISDNFATSAGGGLWASHFVVDCVITGNVCLGSGGGYAGYGVIIDSQLLGNEAVNGGGGDGGAYYNCEIRDNTATEQGGGVRSGSLTYCVVRDNTAASGGGVHDAEELTFCTLIGNTASVSGAGLQLSATSTVRNSIIWDNAIEVVGPFVTIEDCIVQGGLPGAEGIIDADPQFVTGPLGDLYLAPTSPARNASSSPPELLVGGTTSPGDPTDEWPYDLGHHYQAELALALVGRGDVDSNGTIDIADAVQVLSFLFLSGDIPCLPTGDLNADGVVDISDAVSLLASLFIPGAPTIATECRLVSLADADGCAGSECTP